jgi:phytoene dehydrogenase-like protein
MGYSIIAPGINDPQPESRNESIVCIIGGVSPNQWMGLSSSEYKQKKDQWTEAMISSVEAVYPSFGKHCVVTDLATPHTFSRYTANPAGAILGFDCSLGMHRPMMKISRPPIRGLYIANAWTKNLGGFRQSMKAGRDAAKQIMTGS